MPRASDHTNDNDEDPHGVQEANVGFWGSKAVVYQGRLLVFNSDLNRGLYILEAPGSTPAGGGGSGTGARRPASAAADTPATGGSLAAAGALALAAGWMVARGRSRRWPHGGD